MTAAGAEYGGALYELAVEEGLEQTILEQLDQVCRLLAENPAYVKLLAAGRGLRRAGRALPAEFPQAAMREG